MPINLRLKPPTVDQPRHVIDEYKHRAQTITCTCGWHGSCASPDGRTSDWRDHLNATRTTPKR